MRDATCPAIHAGMVAAEKGVPFLPIRGILGTDVLRYRPDWRVIDNPLSIPTIRWCSSRQSGRMWRCFTLRWQTGKAMFGSERGAS